MFQFALVMSLGAIWARGLPPCGVVRLGSLLKKSNDGNTTVQDSLAALHGHTWTQANFTPSRCVKHWKIARGKGTIPEGPNYLGLSQRQCSAMVYSLDTAGDSQRFSKKFYCSTIEFFNKSTTIWMLLKSMDKLLVHHELLKFYYYLPFDPCYPNRHIHYH